MQPAHPSYASSGLQLAVIAHPPSGWRCGALPKELKRFQGCRLESFLGHPGVQAQKSLQVCRPPGGRCSTSAHILIHAPTCIVIVIVNGGRGTGCGNTWPGLGLAQPFHAQALGLEEIQQHLPLAALDAPAWYTEAPGVLVRGRQAEALGGAAG